MAILLLRGSIIMQILVQSYRANRKGCLMSEFNQTWDTIHVCMSERGSLCIALMKCYKRKAHAAIVSRCLWQISGYTIYMRFATFQLRCSSFTYAGVALCCSRD